MGVQGRMEWECRGGGSVGGGWSGSVDGVGVLGRRERECEDGVGV